jgi:thiol-disulfide isomerase/thioredoxin
VFLIGNIHQRFEERMIARTSQHRLWLALGLVAAFGTLEVSTGSYGAEPVDDRETIAQIRDDWFTVMLQAGNARRTAKSPTELEQVSREFEAQQQPFVERCLTLSRKHADDWIGIAALNLVACSSPKTEQGLKALESLVKQAASANLDNLAQGLSFAMNTSKRPIHRVGSLVLDRVKQAPDHPQAAKLLASVVCGISVDSNEGASAPPEFVEAADLIVDRYTESADIVHFCEQLGRGHAWAGPFERHLRTILEKNSHREVKVVALFALASVIQGTTESRQMEAASLYEEFVAKYDGSKEYHFAGIEQALNKDARDALTELSLRGLGKPVPEIAGVDLDGRAMKLSEHRGKVVLLGFWATWCGPCMRMIPHERDIAKRLEGKPFVIVGVNADDDLKAATDAVVKHGITWRSFRDKSNKNARSISEEWMVGFPTFYLIDQEGIIRKRWIGDQPPEEMNSSIDQLLEAQATSGTAK